MAHTKMNKIGEAYQLWISLKNSLPASALDNDQLETANELTDALRKLQGLGDDVNEASMWLERVRRTLAN